MNRLGAFWHSSVGKKAVMAVTGLILVAYLITHVLANLLVFEGPSRINALRRDAARAPAAALWGARLVLLAALVLHIVAAVQLTAPEPGGPARSATPAAASPQVSTLAARTIRWGGALILVFLVYHILHFTTGTAPSRTSSS